MIEATTRLAELFAQPPLDGLIAAGQAVLTLRAAGVSQAGVPVWANGAALALFGASDSEALARLLAGPGDAVTRQIVRMAHAAQPGSPPRLVKVRFARAGRAGAILTLRCWRVSGDPDLFVVATLDAPEDIRHAGQSDRHVSPPAEASANASAPEIATASPVAAAAAVSAPPARGPLMRRGNVRFLWRSDGDNRLVAFDDTLCEVLGCARTDLAGKRFEDLIETLPLTPAGPLRAALSRRDTWSRIEVLWPLRDGQNCAPVTLGGLPSFDRSGVFDGYSGFGVVHLDEVVARPAVPVIRETEDQASGNDDSPPRGTASAGLIVTEPQYTAATSAPLSEKQGSGRPSNVVRLHARQKDQPVIRHSVVSRITGPSSQPDDPGKQAPVASDAGADRTDAGDVGQAHVGTTADLVAAGPGSSESALQEAGAGQPGASSMAADGADMRAAGDAGRDELLAMSENSDPGALDATSDAPDDKTADAVADPVRLNVPKAHPDGSIELSSAERNAFREIARALGVRARDGAESSGPGSAPRPLSPAAIAAALAGESGAHSGNEDEAPVRAIGGSGSAERASEQRAIDVETSRDDASLDEQEAVEATAIADIERERLAAVAGLLDRIGNNVLVMQDGKAVFANRSMLETLGYPDFETFEAAGGAARMFKGRDPEAMARDAAGGALPVITSNGDILTLKGKLQSAEWSNRSAILLTLAEDKSLETEAKMRGLELDIRRRESEVRELHAILDTATDGVVLLDEDARILSLNGSGQALFGYDQNEVVGEPLSILLARESHRTALEYFNGLKSDAVRSVLNDGREVTGRAHQGGAIPLFMTIGRIASSPEQRFCVVLRDVTQWKKAERELSEARREAERTSSLKSDFLAKISHEVRTPLNAILGFAEVIMDERFGPVGNERYKDYLKDIHASGTHVLSLINDLLDLSKIEAGKMDLDFSSVDVSKVVNECVSIMQSQAIRERVVIRLSLAPRLPNVVADERSLRQIVLNLLSNAVKYNEPGGQVIVSTALTDSGAAVIRIRDTGIGMDDKDVKLSLEPFRQIATARRAGGTGLGLPLTKALVEANRASLNIKSKVDEGTLVEVSFPPTRVLAE